MAEVQGEIQAIIRQITASVSFLPMIDESCTFEMLVYTDKDTETPLEWQESDAKLVKGGKQVMPLRQFSTNIHTVSKRVRSTLTNHTLVVVRQCENAHTHNAHSNAPATLTRTYADMLHLNHRSHSIVCAHRSSR
jgi:hypothetical protein